MATSKKKITTIEELADLMQDSFVSVGDQIDGLHGDVRELQTRVGSLEKSMTSVLNKLEAVPTRDEMHHIVRSAYFEALESRVAKLEAASKH